ncbi:DUF721 domain-containing protein [Bdellovibrionota bacterium FG-1]
MAFDRLLDILKKAGARYPLLTRRMDEAQALGRWDKAVGPAIAKHSRAIRVQDSVLCVEVDHPIWKSELHHRKRQILDILNGVAPNHQNQSVVLGFEPPLTDLFFVLSPSPPTKK